jgi:hypothetical protein
VSFATITLRVASRRVFIVVVYFVIDSVRKILDIPSYVCMYVCISIPQAILKRKTIILQGFVNTGMNLRVPLKGSKFLD